MPFGFLLLSRGQIPDRSSSHLAGHVSAVADVWMPCLRLAPLATPQVVLQSPTSDRGLHQLLSCAGMTQFC